MRAKATAELTPAAQGIAVQIDQLKTVGVNDRGRFLVLDNKLTGGFTDVIFEKPAKRVDVNYLKELSNEDTYDLQMQLLKMEKGLNCRDELVAELAKEKPNLGKVDTLAKALVKLSVLFDDQNWAMGTVKIRRKKLTGSWRTRHARSETLKLPKARYCVRCLKRHARRSVRSNVSTPRLTNSRKSSTRRRQRPTNTNRARSKAQWLKSALRKMPCSRRWTS